MKNEKCQKYEQQEICSMKRVSAQYVAFRMPKQDVMYWGSLVKFCDDNFIGRPEIRWNALHWLKLEVLPKKCFWGYMWDRNILDLHQKQ